MKKRVTLLLLAALFLGGCGVASSEINEIGLVYAGGVVEDKTYEGILEPGATNNRVGMGSTVYRYPTDQRSWVSGQDAPEVTTVSNDEVQLSVPYQLYFTINQDEETIREFHENIGVKTEAWKPEGWSKMLNTYFAPQVDRAVDEAALKFDWRELRSNEKTRQEFQNAVVTSLKRKINEVIGGDYFCGPKYTAPGDSCGDYTFTIGKPEPVNGALAQAIEQEQINSTRVAAQEAENRRIRAELEARREEVALFGPQVYACLKQAEAAEKAKVAPPPCFYSGESAQAVVNVE